MRELLSLILAICIGTAPAFAAENVDTKGLLSLYTLKNPGARFRPEQPSKTDETLTRGSTTSKSPDIFQTISNDMKAQRYEKAIKKLNTLITSGRDLPLAYAKRAKCWAFLGNIEKATADSNEAIRRNRKLSEPYVVLGLCAMQRNDARGAISSFNKALENDTANSEALLFRAQCYLSEGSTQEAISDLDQVVKTDPRNVDALWARLRAYGTLEKWDLAKIDGEKIIKIEPNCPEGHVGLAMALASLGNGYQCVPEFQKACVCYEQFNAPEQAATMRKQLAKLIPMFNYGKNKSP